MNTLKRTLARVTSARVRPSKRSVRKPAGVRVRGSSGLEDTRGM